MAVRLFVRGHCTSDNPIVSSMILPTTDIVATGVLLYGTTEVRFFVQYYRNDHKRGSEIFLSYFRTYTAQLTLLR